MFALREHLRARADLVRVRTMLKNRVHAVLHRRGVMLSGDLFTKGGRQTLATLSLDDAGRSILDRYLAQLDSMNAAIAESTKDLESLVTRQRWCASLARLRTMPGVGLITGLTLLAELGEIGRFRSRAAVSNWAGLVPVIRDSNERHYAGGITRRGSSHLRAAMTEAAWQAIRSSRRYRSIFERISAGKSKQVSIVAVARRMLEDAWTMLVHEEVFRDADGSEATKTSKKKMTSSMSKMSTSTSATGPSNEAIASACDRAGASVVSNVAG